MSTNAPTILALDFDGVICDGLLEYFQTAWRTYCKIWQPENTTPPPDLADKFYRLRPVIESGWEMPVLLRALLLGVSETQILPDWSTVLHQCIDSENLQPSDLGQQVDKIRDEWITNDLEGWLALHRFYPGVIERLQQILETPTQVFIVTTKEGRFAKQLLQQQGIELSEDRIIGKEIKRPKHQTLRQLIQDFTAESVSLWFVEDRLNTLLSVEQQSDLAQVRLYLADWGYNTAAHRDEVRNHPKIQLLSLSEFAQNFSAWSN
jgi:phosphoglycolate phosphatase-like HAD superfamily hydrolase